MIRTFLAAAAIAGLAGAAQAQTTAPPPAQASPPAGIGAYAINMIEKACLPLIRGQKIKALAPTLGLKHSGDDWALPLQGVEKILLSPPTQANPSVCILTLNYEIDQSKAVVDALSAWAAAQTPPLGPVDAAYQPNPSLTSWAWQVDNDQAHEGMVFNAQKTADGKPLGRNYDVGTVLFSWRGP